MTKLPDGVIQLPDNRWVHPGYRKCLVWVPDERGRAQVAKLPGADFGKENSGAAILPLTEKAIAGLWEAGVNITGLEPFHYYYQPPKVEGQFNPLAHQLETAAFLTTHPRAYCTSTARTGKTGAVVLALDYLNRVKQVPGAALIVSPVSVMRGVWDRTIQTTLPWASVSVLHGGTGKADRLKKLCVPAQYYIINYDGLAMIKDELYDRVRQGTISKVVFDELTHYGNEDSQRFKAADRVVNGSTSCPYVWGLTGTPGGKTEAVYGYTKLVNYARMPWKRSSSWLEATRYRYGTQVWQWRDKPEADALVKAVMQPNIRYRKEDVIDLPPVLYIRRDCELSPAQNKLYRKLRSDMIAMTENGQIVEALQQAALIGKLFQAALGLVITASGQVDKTDNAPRLAVIEELIQESERKTVIFCAYVAALDDLVAHLNKKKITAAKVDGSVTGLARERIFDDFQNKDNPRVLVAHPKTTAYGVELSAADQMIFNGPPLSGVHTYMQAVERLSSSKQTAGSISIIQLSATDEERDFFAALDKQMTVAEATAKLFAQITGR
jgi:superfamily II DNA or RNA helicase